MSIKINNIDTTLIKTGDALIVSGNSWLSRSIQWFTKSRYNHSGIFYWCYGNLFIIEEDTYRRGLGLIMTPFSQYLSSNNGLLIRRPKFPIDGSECGAFMLPYLGKAKYSLWDLIVAQPIYQLSNKKWWIGGTTMKDNRTVCSGWCYFVYNNFSKIFPDWFKKSPADLAIDSNFEDKFIRN